MGAKSLAERLALSQEEADRLYAQYFSAFTKVTAWMNQKKIEGMALGYIETHFGRKWTLWDLQSGNRALRGKAERLCVNAPVQGTAADYMKISMLRAQAALKKKGWWQTKVRLINNLHDALTFEADNDIDPNELRELLKPCVAWAVEGFPKIVADWEVGTLWGSCKRWRDEVLEFTNGEWQLPAEEEAPEPEAVPEILESEPEVAPEPEPEGRHLIVTIKDMLTRETLSDFVNLLKNNPGPHQVLLKTPEGTLPLASENMLTCLTPDDQGLMSLTLGGALVEWENVVDLSSLEGLDL